MLRPRICAEANGFRQPEGTLSAMTVLGIDTRRGMDPVLEQHLAGFDDRASAPLPARERRTEAAVAAAFLAVAVPLAVLRPGPSDVDGPAAVLCVLAYALVSRVTFPTGTGYTVPTQLVFVPMLFALPPAWVPAAVALAILLGNLPDYVTGRRRVDRALLVPGDAFHAVGPAVVFVLAGASEPGEDDWAVYLAALLAQFTLDFVVSTLRERFALGMPTALQPRLLGWVYLVDLLLSPVGLLAALAIESHPWAILLVLPLVGLLALFATERRARIEHALELSRAYRGTTLLLNDVLDAEDSYTGMHSREVVSLSLAVADEMGLDHRQRRNVEFGALLHDVGKIAVPPEILHKPGPLDDEEWEVMRRHTLEGQRMLDRVGGVLHDVGRVVRASHERWDGCGYPDGLRDDEIPLEAAIVSCCDAMDAMTSDRSYRRAMPLCAALDELQAEAGRQFSPTVVPVVARLLQGVPGGVREPGASLG
jgi:HD-GYP domain-containing protein (c-di-GMP phosphodiesterase class II)